MDLGGLQDSTACVSSAVLATTTLVFGGRPVPPRLSLLPGTLRVCVCVVESLRVMAVTSGHRGQQSQGKQWVAAKLLT